MAAKTTASAPLTFDLKKDLLDKIEGYQKKAGIRSKSEVIRDAIDSFDFKDFRRELEPHRQISVRLPLNQKKELLKVARQKKVSVGELLRAALENLPDTPSVGTVAKAKEAASVATAKRPARGKAKKTAAKKAPAKKAAKKTAAKKASAKKASAKKTAAKKAPAKKTAAKKAPVKKTAAKKTAAKKTAAKKTVARAASKRPSTVKKAAKKAPAKKTAAKKAPVKKTAAKKKAAKKGTKSK